MTTMMEAYVLSSMPTPWGDYGNILVHGMTSHLERDDGLLQLERAGSRFPAITQPGLGHVVVKEAVRAFLAARMPALEFRQVLLRRCVRLEWADWDAALDEPAEYPDSGEPEDYILSRPHDPMVAASIGTLWELVPEIVDGIQAPGGALRLSAYRGQHLVRADLDAGHNFVSEAMRDLLLEAAPECLSFKPARLNHD
jgi:hypothetical protein